MRYSIENPLAYINSNIVGFANILENCRKYKIENLVYASTSSVYGANTKIPFLEKDNVDHPLSVYAASKKSNELMAHAYSYLYKLPTTGLRFFTVYGPWGRPDMALFKFTEAAVANEEIKICSSTARKNSTSARRFLTTRLQTPKASPKIPDFYSTRCTNKRPDLEA